MTTLLICQAWTAPIPSNEQPNQNVTLEKVLVVSALQVPDLHPSLCYIPSLLGKTSSGSIISAHSLCFGICSSCIQPSCPPAASHIPVPSLETETQAGTPHSAPFPWALRETPMVSHTSDSGMGSARAPVWWESVFHTCADMGTQASWPAQAKSAAAKEFPSSKALVILESPWILSMPFLESKSLSPRHSPDITLVPPHEERKYNVVLNKSGHPQWRLWA